MKLTTRRLRSSTSHLRFHFFRHTSPFNYTPIRLDVPSTLLKKETLLCHYCI
ncbi:hypothetical protein EXIGLDRAFT_722871 [Exidia glandulosa HHB12029]|uniref:Uncharacterized protein n=1 Tax=Exidia glandulosa HHB12029 TaxID=1314781 RepID=A0A165F2T3_EXIGL|nr:hypothetical protein EXIGLDRAFT_722871 [Exidia glandulosa HHB12029]